VLDEEQTALRVDYDRLHTQRHAAGKARIEMQTTLDCELQGAAYESDVHLREYASGSTVLR
jgi:hypothetical protein